MYTFIQSSIDKHVKRVHEKSAVPEKICETCGKAFWQESKLQAHILKVHSVMWRFRIYNHYGIVRLCDLLLPVIA